MSGRANQQDRASEFLDLHRAESIFVLPNAWDVASAMIFAREGFPAIGTTSAGIAASLGRADGQNMSFKENLDVVERIAHSMDLPVSADFESGYGEDLDGLAQRAQCLMRAGVIGVNIEDRLSFEDGRLLDPGLHQEKIRSIRRAGNEVGIRVFINARTDAYLLGNSPQASLRQAIERGNAYVESGADCVFVPDTGDLSKEDIKILVSEIIAPINLIAGATTPCLSDLQEIGVSRVSLGPRPMRVLLSLLREIASEIRTKGTFESMSNESVSYSEVNSWFAS